MLSDLDLQSMFRSHLKLISMDPDITLLAHYSNIFDLFSILSMINLISSVLAPLDP